MVPLLRAGYDFESDFVLELDGDAESLTGYTLAACVVDERKRSRIVDDEAAVAVGGATGRVRVTFSAANTARISPDSLGVGDTVTATGAYQRKAWLELAIITPAGKRLPVAHHEILVELGWAGVA